MVAVTWEYRSRVMPIWLWPGISLTSLGWMPRAKPQRGGAVAQVVEADPRQSGPLQQRIVTPLLEVKRVKGLAHGVREDQPVVVSPQAK
jgi:hypothetical protein